MAELPTEHVPIVVDFIAGPGAGKTTIAHRTMSDLKLKGKKVDFAQEVAKEYVRTKEYEKLDDQYIISYEQYKALRKLENLDYIVTDGSLLLGLYYNLTNPNNVSNIYRTEKAILKWHSQFKHRVIFLKRGNYEYDTEGRYQTSERAKQMDDEIESILKKFNIDYISLESSANGESMDRIVNFVLSDGLGRN